jgi:hypothetical protein
MEIILDACCMCDFLEQYFSEQYANYGYGEFKNHRNISRELASKLNRIMNSGSPIVYGSVITPTFSFIEIARKWGEWVNGRFSVYEMHGFIKEPPIWFNITPIDSELLPFFISVPIINSLNETLEWTDALYFATIFSRGDATKATLVTSDRKLKRLMQDSGMDMSYV